MPLTLQCKQCGHKTTGTYADKCFKCGVVDWMRDLSPPSTKASKKSSGLSAGCLLIVGMLWLGLALWGLVALVKFFWIHS
jgi:hypothetical protein